MNSRPAWFVKFSRLLSYMILPSSCHVNLPDSKCWELVKDRRSRFNVMPSLTFFVLLEKAMKKKLMLLASMLLVFGRVSFAGAISFFDPAAIGAPVFLNDSNPSYSYTFNLDSDKLYEDWLILPYGMTDIEPGDIINSATLYMGTSDDAFFDGPERLSMTLDGDSFYEGIEHGILDPFEFDVTAQLVDHMLNVTVNRRQGDFYFWYAALDGDYSKAFIPVPEPATMLFLLGGGLIGLSCLRRKKLSRRG